MPNLVGIGLSQVPTNSMLGGLAYQDPEHASIKDLDLKNLSQINSEIADTAVDVFVYDTRKDSDGGAWRKRTQHTSWYNETLGTATRGTRREFPAVAVIVAEATQLTIYDGDDPNLPMWMVFNLLGAVGNPNSNMLPRGGSGTESDITSIACLNGKLVVGLKDVSGTVGEGLVVIDFISELARIHRTTDSGYTGAIYRAPISGRNSNGEYYGDYNSLAIVAETCNDVAMTVLPNAPIDDTTGLPVPTIAVATDGGASIIKDDGTVSDLKRGSTSYTNSVQFTDNNSIMLVWGHASDAIRHINHYSYADWQSDKTDYDQSTGYHELPQFGSSALQSPLKATASGIVDGVLLNLNGQNRMSAKWDDYGLKIADLNDSDRANGMVCHIRSDSNSGWMHGDCKGAFLSDTDTTDAVGTELHPNGNSDFSSTDVSYISNTASGTATVTNGQLVLSGGTSNYSDHIFTVSNLEVGAQYMITIDYVAKSAGAGSIGFYVNGAYLNELNDSSGYIARSTGKSYTFYFTTAFSSRTIDLVTGGNTSVTHTVDNWSIKKVEEDRSVNNNGLQVFGTVPKSAVATGAELVSYGPFTDSNYLKQPYNSDLNFGTGAFSIMFWIKSTTHSVYSRIMNRVTDISDNRVEFYSDSGTNLVFYTRDNASATSVGVGNGSLILNQWHCVVGTRESSGRMTIYIDGIEKAAVAGTSIRDLTSSTAEFIIGNGGDWDAANPFPGQLSLLRISATVPSPEQIKKIYEDEKHLFQENAKATLYGSSDAVTALAYDEDTELLHVGTSAGRSEFQGLRRINNTTTAVTTAISASNELVAEQ